MGVLRCLNEVRMTIASIKVSTVVPSELKIFSSIAV